MEGIRGKVRRADHEGADATFAIIIFDFRNKMPLN
jgi:hypothetical protein